MDRGVKSAEGIRHDIMTRMLMASTTMAARIERAECGTVLDFATEAQRRGGDVLIHHIGGGVAVFAGPGQPFNKAIGLGFAGAIEPAAFEEMERAFDARGAEIRVELATLADPSVGRSLTQRGYELVGYENVLGLGLTGISWSASPPRKAGPPRTTCAWRARATRKRACGSRP